MKWLVGAPKQCDHRGIRCRGSKINNPISSIVPRRAVSNYYQVKRSRLCLDP